MPSPGRPGLDSDPEPSLEPGTELDMTPPTPAGQTIDPMYSRVRITLYLKGVSLQDLGSNIEIMVTIFYTVGNLHSLKENLFPFFKKAKHESIMESHREKHIYAIKPEVSVCSHKTMSAKKVCKISQPALCTCS